MGGEVSVQMGDPYQPVSTKSAREARILRPSVPVTIAVDEYLRGILSPRRWKGSNMEHTSDVLL